MQPSSYTDRLLLATVLCLILSACSSGGSTGDPANVNSDPAAQLPPADSTPSGDNLDNIVGGDNSTPVDDDTSSTAPVGTQGYQRAASVIECSTQDLNAWVDFDMRDYYIYYDQVPQLNLANYDDPAELVRDLRVDPDIYSFLTDAQAQDSLRQEGQTSGYGFNSEDDPQGVYRFSRIRVGSPMHAAGIKRGDRFLEINGIPLIGMSNAMFNELLFEEGAAPILTVQTDGESPRSIQVIPAEYIWDTSPYATIFTMEDGHRIGYLLVEAFYQPTESAMDSHIAWLLDRGIDDFILDLRYNRGGSVRVSERLASQIAGPAFSGEPFQIRMRNDKYSFLNYTSYITDEFPALSMPRLAVLTTESSASASETIINGLQPYLDVTVIGALTRGKPFTSRSIEYCGRNLNAMHSLRTNSVGVSILGGIQPDCAVQDQWTYETNDSRDALTSAALAFLNQGVCETQVAASASPRVRSASGPQGVEPASILMDKPQSFED